MGDLDQVLLRGPSVFGAALTVFLTTLDDKVWLLPFVASRSISPTVRTLHALTFAATLLSLSIFCCIVAVVIEEGFAATVDADVLEFRLGLFGVILCWLIAGGFYWKAQMKRKRRQKEREATESDPEEVTLESFQQRTGYGTVSQEIDSDEEIDPNEWQEIPSGARPFTVMTLTSVGFLDEVSYFPTLILGHIFTVWELCVGTMIAAIVMLSIQAFLAREFKPLIDFLDRKVPLYGIIVAFAIILTLHLVWESLVG
jgi:hypothetical protein